MVGNDSPLEAEKVGVLAAIKTLPPRRVVVRGLQAQHRVMPTDPHDRPQPTPAEGLPTPAEELPTPAEGLPTPAEGLPTPAEELLSRYFGYPSFRGRQAEIIEHVRRGRHVMVVMPTGRGKSLCYQIPALFPEFDLVLVLSPLIALMKDQVDALQSRGIDAALINSSLDRETRIARYAEVASGKYRLLYVTPERFRKPEFLEVLRSRSVSLLAVDEAHCVSQWGHDFRPDYSRLAEIRELLGFPTHDCFDGDRDGGVSRRHLPTTRDFPDRHHAVPRGDRTTEFVT